MYLTRQEFKNEVFKRENYKCAMCDKAAVDAHHIVDRGCYPDGGYYVDNGVALCAAHHVDAEKGLITCTELREAAGIQCVVLPDNLDPRILYNKWGRPLSKNKLHKYPKIWHLPWSRSLDTHDRVFTDEDVESFFEGREVVITEKLDGENTNMYNDHIHARSMDSGHHVSRSWVKALHASIKHEIPDNWRVCGENVYAKHSILYHGLPTAFFVFGVYDENNTCLSWEDTKYFAEILGLACVPVLEDNKLFQRSIHEEVYTGESTFNRSEQEGYVVRLKGQINWTQHCISYAKFVRPNHVRTDKNWMTQPMIKNEGEF